MIAPTGTPGQGQGHATRYDTSSSVQVLMLPYQMKCRGYDPALLFDILNVEQRYEEQRKCGGVGLTPTFLGRNQVPDITGGSV
jgi:hypothetical protein